MLAVSDCRLYQAAPTGQISMRFGIGDFYENMLRRPKFCYIGNSTWGPRYLSPLPAPLNCHWNPYLRPKSYCAVCPPTAYISAAHWTILREICYWRLYDNLKKFHIWLQLSKNVGSFTLRTKRVLLFQVTINHHKSAVSQWKDFSTLDSLFTIWSTI